MRNNGINLFIVDDSKLVLNDLRIYLKSRFGNDLNISTFDTGENALKKIDRNTSIVILDHDLKNEDGNDILKLIKEINSETKVIMFTSNQEIGVAIESFRKGASDVVIKGEKAQKKIASLVKKIITYPVSVMVKEFKLNKYLAIFILTFFTVGILVYITLQIAK